MAAESQPRNPVLSGPPAQDVTKSHPQPQKPKRLPQRQKSNRLPQRQKPNRLLQHMKVPLITRHPPAQPSTNNPTDQSGTRSESVALIACKITLAFLGYMFLVILLWCFVRWIAPSINDLSAYTVSSATVHPFNISSSRLTAAWDISLYVENLHQKIGVNYDHIQASIYYGPHLLSEVTIPSFFLHLFGTKTVHARLMAHSALVDVGAAESMVRDLALHGAVDFRFRLVARYVRLFFEKWVVRVSCENVTVGFPASDDLGPGVLLGPPRKCNHLVDET